MKTEDDIMRLFAQADPAGDDEGVRTIDAAGYLDTLRTRSTDMTIIETAPTPTEQPGRRRWIVTAAVAAAVALLVVAALVVASREDAPEVPAAPTTTTVAPEAAADPTPESVAQAFVEAIAASDVAAATALLAPEADISNLANGTDDWQRVFLLREAQGHRLLVRSCESIGANGATTTVSCAFDFHDLRSDELGRAPFTGNTFEVVVEDGMVLSAQDSVDITVYSEQMWEPFNAWIESTHPDDVDIMYSEDAVVQYSDESIQLWDQRTREYVAAVVGAKQTAAAFLDAFGAFDVDTAGSYLADDADTTRIAPFPVQDFRQALGWLQALDYQQTMGTCDLFAVRQSGMQMRCPFDFYMLGSDQMGSAAYSGSHFDVIVRDGRVDLVMATWNDADFMPEVFQPFTDWLAATYPDDLAMMIDANENPLMTDESLALWEQHADEYVEHVLGGAPATATP